MSRTVEVTYYTIDELSKEGQARAIDNNRDINTHYAWWDDTLHTCTPFFEVFGLTPKAGKDWNVRFTDFYSQGTGSRFDADLEWTGTQGDVFPEYFPKKLEKCIERIKREMLEFSSLEGSIYGCRYGNNVSFYLSDTDSLESLTTVQFQCLESRVQGIIKDLNAWLYSELKNEYERITSDYNVLEMLDIMECEFTEKGDRI